MRHKIKIILNDSYTKQGEFDEGKALNDLCVLFSVSKCQHEPKPYKGKYANCKHCDTLLQMKP